MEFLYEAKISIPVSQIALLLFASTLTLLWGKAKLALMVNYIFTLYWGFVYNIEHLIEQSGDANVFCYLYFGFGLGMIVIALFCFLFQHGSD